MAMSLKMCNRLIITCIMLAAIGWLTACEQIHEPWVSGADDLRQERNRTTQQAEQLRHRLSYSQIDR